MRTIRILLSFSLLVMVTALTSYAHPPPGDHRITMSPTIKQQLESAVPSIPVFVTYQVYSNSPYYLSAPAGYTRQIVTGNGLSYAVYIVPSGYEKQKRYWRYLANTKGSKQLTATSPPHTETIAPTDVTNTGPTVVEPVGWQLMDMINKYATRSEI